MLTNIIEQKVFILKSKIELWFYTRKAELRDTQKGIDYSFLRYSFENKLLYFLEVCRYSAEIRQMKHPIFLEYEILMTTSELAYNYCSLLNECNMVPPDYIIKRISKTQAFEYLTVAPFNVDVYNNISDLSHKILIASKYHPKEAPPITKEDIENLYTDIDRYSPLFHNMVLEYLDKRGNNYDLLKFTIKNSMIPNYSRLSFFILYNLEKHGVNLDFVQKLAPDDKVVYVIFFNQLTNISDRRKYLIAFDYNNAAFWSPDFKQLINTGDVETFKKSKCLELKTIKHIYDDYLIFKEIVHEDFE